MTLQLRKLRNNLNIIFSLTTNFIFTFSASPCIDYSLHILLVSISISKSFAPTSLFYSTFVEYFLQIYFHLLKNIFFFSLKKSLRFKKQKFELNKEQIHKYFLIKNYLNSSAIPRLSLLHIIRKYMSWRPTFKANRMIIFVWQISRNNSRPKYLYQSPDKNIETNPITSYFETKHLLFLQFSMLQPEQSVLQAQHKRLP